MNQFDLKLLKRLAALAKPYWVSEERWKARGLLLLLGLLLIGDTWFSVLFNEQSGEFTSALAAREAPRFWQSVRTFVGLLVVAVPIYSYYYYVRDKLAIQWRRWLTARTLTGYFEGRAFYHLLRNEEIDNPDQRIAEDISSFTSQSLTFLLMFANAAFQLMAFSAVLWSISRLLVFFLILYATASTAITLGVFGRKMTALYFEKRKKEANFRFSLMRIRENAESIALYGGERQERVQIERFFGEVFANYNRLIGWSLRRNFFYYFYHFMTIVMPAVIIAPRVLSGELEVGNIVRAEGAFAAVLGALTILADNLEALGSFATDVNRLDAFSRSLSPVRTTEGLERGRIAVRESEQISFDNVTLQTPNYQRTLVRDLTISVPPGENLMIQGARGCGKSSLLRLIAGLWDSGAGRIERPRPQDMLFLPQHAYMVLGSLRSQLCYPNVQRVVPDAELHDVLESVNLPDLVERCGGFDTELDFERVLSTGERQRLAFARVFLSRPRYVLLDEATSALDQDNEAALYRQLAATSSTLVSVSHHPALKNYHSNILELEPGGGWTLRSTIDNDLREP
jgi:vitamin B12/bleomycin/antimicrobial peptide transport system ATP-binding/permease protein